MKMENMKKLNPIQIVKYVEDNISTFHHKRSLSLSQLKLEKILKRKNPYLFKAKNVMTASDLVKLLMDAHLSSQEETIFGEFLEGLAIFICGKVYRGTKSGSEGIDLEFERGGVKHIVAIKSGPNWGNSSQIKKMRSDFQRTKRTLGTNRSRINIVAVNGCCYGRDNNPEKQDYIKLCGERFWKFISGDKNLFVDIIGPLGHRAKQKNEEFLEAYSILINKFTLEFSKKFCRNGRIDWAKLVRLNSAIKNS